MSIPYVLPRITPWFLVADEDSRSFPIHHLEGMKWNEGETS
jgi:hypothetical protein